MWAAPGSTTRSRRSSSARRSPGPRSRSASSSAAPILAPAARRHSPNFWRLSTCPILPMGYESAELAKIAINAFLVSSVTVANTLAELCEAIGADWSEIAPALELDRRIGPHAYLRPDSASPGATSSATSATIRSLAREHGTDAGVIDAWLATASIAGPGR